MLRTIQLFSFVAMTAIGASQLFAAPFTSYTNRPTWEGAVGPLSGTEDFNSFGTDTSFQGVSVPLNNMTVTGTTGANGANSQKIDAPPTQFPGFYNVDGTAYLLGDLAGTSQFIRFDFTTEVTAWGADFNGVGNPPRNTRIDVFDSSDALLGTVAMSSATDQTLGFYGFQTMSLASYIVLSQTTGSNDAFGIDNIGFVTSDVPEPTSMALFGLTALGMGVVRRRRKAGEPSVA